MPLLRLPPPLSSPHLTLIIINPISISTYDRDNDLFASGNCAANFESGWWFADCFRSNFNGKFPVNDRCEDDDNCMKTYALGADQILQSVVMKIKPNPDRRATDWGFPFGLDDGPARSKP